MTLRLGFRTLSLGLFLSASLAWSVRSDPDAEVVRITYDPSTHEVILALSEVTFDGYPLIDMPDWLEQTSPDHTHSDAGFTAVFSGVLPEVNSAKGASGASDNGAFLFDVLSWLPDFHDLAPAMLVLEMPVTHRGLATGELVSEATTKQSYTATFRMHEDWQSTDVFFGPYEVRQRLVELSTGEIAIRTYFRPEEKEFSDDYLEAVANYITQYSNEIGPYPHESYAVVSAPIPVGYALDGMTYISQRILGHPYMLGRSLAHEVLHSWWGSGVGIDYLNGNWAEGLTTFQADYALAEDRGPEAARDMRVGWVRDLARLSEERMQPLVAFRSSSHAGDQSEGYGKTAMVFHMLRQEIGSEAFTSVIRRFYQANLNKIAGWKDLQAAFEEVTGRSFGWFFDQWVERAGLPRIEIVEAELSEMEELVGATVQVRQDAPFYKLQVPLVFEMNSGQTVRRNLEVQGGLTEAQLMLPDRPSTVVLDPDFDLARRPLEGELSPILRGLEGAEVIEAVDVTGLEQNRSAIADALAPVLGKRDLSWRNDIPNAEPGPAILVIGTSDDITAKRPPELGPVPGEVQQGQTRIWVERSPQGRLWGFVSFEAPGAIAADTRALRYYTSQSFVAFADGRAVANGVWPMASSPATVRFSADAKSGN